MRQQNVRFVQAYLVINKSWSVSILRNRNVKVMKADSVFRVLDAGAIESFCSERGKFDIVRIKSCILERSFPVVLVKSKPRINDLY